MTLGKPRRPVPSAKVIGPSQLATNQKMIESLISAAIAVISGGAVLTTRIHSRILELDKRIDQLELGMAQSYVSKADFERTLERVETHMLRIEDKLDDLVKVSSTK
jgi:septal ring factor EnvC (AmiA/AmiB activator)